MAVNFYITGLPRSRTAWFANFFTYGDSFCYHEASKFWVHNKSLASVMSGADTRYVGNSDSGLLLYFDEIIRDAPSAKWVIIKRDKNEVEKSLKRIFKHGYTDVLDIASGLLDRCAAITCAMVVDFDALREFDIMERIWTHCLPDIPFPVERWRMLNDMKVELLDDVILTEFETARIFADRR